MSYYFTLHYGTPHDVILSDRGTDQHNNLGAADAAALVAPPATTHRLPPNSSYQVIEAAARMFGIPLVQQGRHVLVIASPDDIRLWVVAGPY